MAHATIRCRFRHALGGFFVLLALAVTIAASSTASAQCGGGCNCSHDAEIVYVGAGCGPAPVPTLNATPPILGQSMTIYVTSNLPGATLILGSSMPAMNPLSFGGCLVYLDLDSLMLWGPFTSSAAGSWTFDWTSPNTPSLCGLMCNLQVAIIPPQGAGVRFSNAIMATMGCDPGGNPNGIPNHDYCTYSKGGFAGSGTPGQLMNNHYTGTFPAGLEVGDFNPGNGNAAPNGLFWQSNSTGKTALKTYLLGGSSSGAFTSDQTNPTSGNGGGVFGRQTAALTLNVGFNDAGFTNSNGTGFGDLVYIQAGKSLSGLRVRQVVAVANIGLSGLGLPPGYTFASLKDLVEELNLSFDGCCQSCWSQSHLFRP